MTVSSPSATSARSATEALESLYEVTSDSYELGFEGLIEMLRRDPTQDERYLMSAGMNRAAAMVFLRQRALSTDERWLIDRGVAPRQVRDFLQTPMSVYEAALIKEGIAPDMARADGAQRVARHDVVNVIDLAILESGKAFSDQQMVRLMRETSYRFVAGGARRDALLDATIMLPDGSAASLLEAVVEDAKIRLKPGYGMARIRQQQAYEQAGATSAPQQPDRTAGMVTDTGQASSSARAQWQADATDLPPYQTAARTQHGSASGLPDPSDPFEALMLKAFAHASLGISDAKALQQGLISRGFDVGIADGNLGAKSWEAIARYAQKGHLDAYVPSRDSLRLLETSLATIGYRGMKVDGVIDAATERALNKFFTLRKESVGDLAPETVHAPDFAAIAAVHSSYHKKRGNVLKE